MEHDTEREATGEQARKDRLSLPLPFEEAMSDILRVKPPPDEKPRKKRQRRDTKRRDKKS